jgi:hypothetical protein
VAYFSAWNLISDLQTRSLEASQSNGELETDCDSSDHILSLAYQKLSAEALGLTANTPWVRVLDLRGTEIDNKSLSKLAKLELYRIDFGESDLNDTGANQLPALKALRRRFPDCLFSIHAETK